MTANRRSLRLGIDLDGVVADFNRGWMARYNAQFDTRLEPELVTAWDDLHPHTHFSDTRAFWRWASGRGDAAGPHRTSIFRDLPPYPEALAALAALAAQKHRVVILSQKPDWAVHDTLAWLAEHRIPTREVHLTSRKGSVACDVYLDDANHHLEAIRQARPSAQICRFVRPWNRPTESTIDVHKWTDFVRFVDDESSIEAS